MEDKILVEDEKKSNQLYNKGFFGKTLSNNRLELDLYEGLYLLEAERLKITNEKGNKLGKKEIMEKMPKKEFIREYPPYKDMRSRGYVLKNRPIQRLSVFFLEVVDLAKRLQNTGSALIEKKRLSI